MASAAVKLMTADEFLLWQQDKEVRYELVDGVPIEMMTGASDVHDRVVINLIVLLGHQLRGTRCRPTTADVALRTTFIVGFPGETEADFLQTLDLIEDVGFDQSFSFLYSRRPGTPAASLPDEVPRKVKQERLERLQAKIDGQAQAISRRMVGTTQRVMVEKHARRDPRQLAGRTENMRWVNFDGPASLVGRFAEVCITEAMPNSLRGRLVA